MGDGQRDSDQRWTREAGMRGQSSSQTGEEGAQSRHGEHGPKSRLRGRGLAAETGEG